jgi:adenylate kinase
MHIALLGPIGAGKGSHAAKLATHLDLLHVVSGELFRANLEKRTAVGLLARRYMAQGELVPDEVTDAMMEEWLWQIAPQQGGLFDGFPRTAAQAQFLDDLFATINRNRGAAVARDAAAIASWCSRRHDRTGIHAPGTDRYHSDRP